VRITDSYLTILEAQNIFVRLSDPRVKVFAHPSNGICINVLNSYRNRDPSQQSLCTCDSDIFS